MNLDIHQLVLPGNRPFGPGGKLLPGVDLRRTATPVANRGIQWYSAALSEFRPPVERAAAIC